MKKLLWILVLIMTSNDLFGQVQRAIEGSSIIRKNILSNQEFTFTRNWENIATFKSGFGETIEIFYVLFTSPDGKIKISGLQLEADILSESIRSSSGSINLLNPLAKKFSKRSIFIDNDDALGLVKYLEREVMPNLKASYKKQSKEHVFKSDEMFFSFLVSEKNQRITIHIADFGPLGDKPGGEEIEFWTESQVDEIPGFLEKLKIMVARKTN